MADEIDMAEELVELATEVGVSAARYAAASMPKGAPGECCMCGDFFVRLVGGACGRCRDKHRLP